MRNSCYIGYLLKKSQLANAPRKKGSVIPASTTCRIDSRVLVEREAFLISPEHRLQERQSRQWLKSRYLILGLLLLLEFAVNFNEIVVLLGKI